MEGISSAPAILRFETVPAALAVLARQSIDGVVLGFGHSQGRDIIGGSLLSAGIPVLSLIHPTAVVSTSARFANGVYVGAGAVVDPGTIVGDFAIINNRAIVCHDTKVGKAVHVCPGATIAGGCSIGDRTWVGAGSVIRDHTVVGAGVLIGCGSVVVRDIDAGSLVYGNPARYRSMAPESF